ncbi:receptor-transporting protein 4-like isoform X3 [Pundamilia nyererei]|uniref:Receptor-transporting protein 4-like isoform X3 n=1 Tax=Pundamilia nyererei TaxID=303518 RepID=A0A9Y6J7U6_9CICH|nr:PREDICTED: receptor-transporting protein 4-like isoform X3 [Pundamilia nyererei]
MSTFHFVSQKVSKYQTLCIRPSRYTAWAPSLWTHTFEELFCGDNALDYGEPWSLTFSYKQTDKLSKKENRRGWKVFSHCAYGNFQCASCRRIWPSVRVVLLFRYRLRGEAKEALLRLFSEIRKNCYGEEDKNEEGDSGATRRRSKPHEKTLCEACCFGLCCQDDKNDK